MKRHASLIPLSHDHHMSLLLSQVLKKDAPQFKGMSKEPKDKAEYIKTHYQTHLIKHFETEEKMLFPFVKGRDKDIDALIEELIKDHREIAKSVLSINVEAADLTEHLNSLGEMIDGHIRKEERILFEKIPLVFSEEELQPLANLIPKSGF
jgi:iron-sulfur cluster repair protein YtfE (RIC family)